MDSRADSESFSISIKKEPNSKLGITFDAGGFDDDLLILNWRSDGPIAKWNEEHPEKQVKANDSIVEVNGKSVRGAPKKLIEEIQCSEEEVMLTLCRTSEESRREKLWNRMVGDNKVHYGSLWYCNLGGSFGGFSSPCDCHEYDRDVQRAVKNMAGLSKEVREKRPTILYLVFGGAEYSGVGGELDPGNAFRWTNCMDRRFPAPLLRLMGKETDATMVVGVLDEQIQQPAVDSCLNTFADRISVHRIPFRVPRWPCSPVLDEIRAMMDGVVNDGGLFVVLDEMKALASPCFDQCFALYPILDMCEKHPSKSLFLEWNPVDHRQFYRNGSVLGYRSREDRAQEKFVEIKHWTGCCRLDRPATVAFNYSKTNKEKKGLPVEEFAIDLSKQTYSSDPM